MHVFLLSIVSVNVVNVLAVIWMAEKIYEKVGHLLCCWQLHNDGQGAGLAAAEHPTPWASWVHADRAHRGACRHVSQAVLHVPSGILLRMPANSSAWFQP